jgi:hypothetical protein
LPNALQAQTTVNGIINSDRTWALQDGPFLIEDDVTVAAQVTLTIEPGVLIVFAGPYWLKVEGTLLAQGSVNEPIVFTSNDANTSWHRLEFLPGSDASILDYVRVSNAGSDSGSGSQAYGALYLAGSTPQLSHLLVQNNSVTGLYAENITTALTISDSEINHNINHTSAGIGAGGIFVEGTNSATITIRNNTVADNRTNSHGGGLYVAGVGSILIDSNQIVNNYAESNYGFGGGIYVANIGGDVTQNHILNNTINHNTADKDGGGIWIDESQITISANELQANMALDSQGGALYIGDTNSQDSIQSVSTMRDNLMFDNYSLESGGAIYLENGSYTLANNILYGNAADDGGGGITNEQGGALMMRTGAINFNNNVVAENAAANGGAISLNGSGNISNNSFVHNASRHILRLAGNLTVHGNTFADNAAELSVLFVPPQLDPIPVVNNNNFFYGGAIDGLAFLVDNLNESLLNAQSNWWGTTDDVEIAWQISTTIDYSGYALAPLTDTPMAPPELTSISYTSDSVSLVWVPRSEPDVAGYKVYWGEQPAPQWDNVMDAGARTDITISGLIASKTYYFAVTAYDDGLGNDLSQTAVIENQLRGNESWYSRLVTKPAAAAQNDSGGGGFSMIFYCLCIISVFGRIRESWLKSRFYK